MYATVADMVARFGDVDMIHASDRNDTHQMDETVIGGALGDASALIDGYLAGRYDLPLKTQPAFLTRICCDVARYYLDDLNVTEKQQNSFDAALKTLAKIGKGELSLGLPAESPAEQSDSDIEMQSAGAVFARKNSQSFI